MYTPLEGGKVYYLRIGTSSQFGDYMFRIYLGTDDYANHISSGAPVAIEVDTEGRIDYGGDIDCFTFRVPENGVYTVQTFGDTDTSGELYNSGFEMVGFNDDLSETNTNFSITQPFLKDKTYYIKVQHQDAETGTGEYTLIVSSTGGAISDDHGNAFKNATEMTVGTAIDGNIDYVADVDFFKFTPGMKGIYTIESLGDTDVLGELYDGSGILLDSDNNTGIGENIYMFHMMEEGQTYYIAIRHNSSAEKGAYQLQVVRVEDDYPESALLNVGDEIAGRIDYPCDTDLFQLVLPSDGAYVMGSTGDTDVKAVLYNSKGVQVYSNQDMSEENHNFSICITLSGIETYYLKVSHQSEPDLDTAGTGDYRLSLQPVEDDAGNSLEEAKEISVDIQVAGSLESIWDADCFKFTAKTSAVYSIKSSGDTDTYAGLYDQNKNLLASDDNTGGGHHFLITYPLEQGKDYYLKINAGTGYDMGAYQFVVTSDTEAPTQPQDLKILSKVGNTVVLQWKASSDNTGIQGYQVFREDGLVKTTKDTTCTDTLKEPGIFRYIVKAVDVAGNVSGASNEVQCDHQPPKAPEGVTVTVQDSTSVVVAWNPVEDIDGIQGYCVYRDGKKVTFTSQTTFTDTNLKANIKYTYTVTAKDHWDNESLPSVPVEAVTKVDVDPPQAPANLYIVSKTGASITLKWALSLDNVGTTGYEVYRDGNKVGSSEAEVYTDSGLEAGTAYTYYVKAFDAAGNRSQASNTVSAVPQLPKLERVSPAEYTTVGGAKQRMYVYFANHSGLSGTSATFEYSKDGMDWTEFGNPVYGPYIGDAKTLYCSSDWDLSQLESGTYLVRYTVLDALNFKDEIMVTYYVDRTAPAEPKNVTGVSLKGSVEVRWNISPEADGRGYRVYRSESGQGEYTLIGQINNKAQTFYEDKNVESGKTYYYKVKAFDGFMQESGFSQVVQVVAEEDTVPPVILGLAPIDGAKLGPKAKITVRAQDNIALSSITLEYSTDDGSTWKVIETKETEGYTVFEFDTAFLGDQVKIRAVALDQANNRSETSPIRTYTLDNTGPQKVVGVVGEPYITSVLLRWDDVADEDFSHFQVEMKNQEGAFVKVATVDRTLGTHVKDLMPNKQYIFRVVAYDAFGNRGTPSEEVAVVTLPDTLAPKITSISPKAGYVQGILHLEGNVKDNVGVHTFTFQISTDKNEWEDLYQVSFEAQTSSQKVCYDMDTSGMQEGTFYIRGIAEDGAGNQCTPSSFVEYRIDRTPPAVVTKFTVSSTAGEIKLKWDKGTDQDIASFRAYRGEQEAGSFEVVGDHLPYLEYIDRDVAIGKTYYYKIAAIDFAGNIGEATEAKQGVLEEDTEVPEVVSVYPENGSILPANPKIHVLVADNYRLAEVKVEYRRQGENEWEEIGSRNLDIYSDTISFEWRNKNLASGTYQVRITAKDQSGNTAIRDMAYSIDVDAPAKPVVTAMAGGWKIHLAWTTGNESDLEGFRIYRSEAEENGYKLIKQTTASAYTDEMLAPGVTYYYKVEAVDKCNNTVHSDVVSVQASPEDPYAPVAEAGDSQVTTVGIEVAFDGRQSKDNDKIEQYVWDFGDGTVSNLATPVHTYLEEGVYTVELTVYDPAGNTDSDTTTVHVHTQQQAGTVEITVLDEDSGEVLGGAVVMLQTADGSEIKAITNGQGVARLVAETGTGKVYAYKNEYQPAFINVEVEANRKTSKTLKLKNGKLVVGGLTVKRLALDEIKNIGIDPYAQENQWVYSFTVNLAFKEKEFPAPPVYVNGFGQFCGDSGKPFIVGEYKVYPKIIPSEHPEIPPKVFYMVIPGEGRWMKEFFEVSLVVDHLADAAFVIADSTAELKLPKDLSLAPTATGQNLLIEMGDIVGGTQGKASWIIRGDQKGEYSLEAEFKGTLLPFNEPVEAVFKTEEPFKVWGDDALEMHIEAQDKAVEGYPYLVKVGIKNVSDAPVYHFFLEVKEDGKEGYIYAPNQALVKTIEKLDPGEIQWFEYVLIPKKTGELYLEKSFVLKTGGNAEVPTVITEIAVPSHMPGNAPVFEEIRNEDGSVTLLWDAVEQAEGYRIYLVRKDGYMSTSLEMLYETDGQTHSLTLDEPDGEKSYLINTLTQKGERYCHGKGAVVGMGTVSGYIAPDFTYSKAQASSVQAGFKVELKGTGLYAITDAEGFFEITNVPGTQQEQTLVISKNGYLQRSFVCYIMSGHVALSTKEDPLEIWAGDMVVDGKQNGAIDLSDIMDVIKSFNRGVGQAGYVEDRDFNRDGAVNMIDIMIAIRHFNTTSADYPDYLR